MDREAAIKAEQALDFLDTYNYPKIKEAVQELRQTFQPIIERQKKEGLMQNHNLKYSYKHFDPIKITAHVISALSNAPKIYEEAANNLEKTHKQTQDILHAIELLDLSEDEMIQMARELHEVRKIRREAKDFTDIMLPLYDLACKYSHIAKEFSSAMSEMQKILKQKENRQYYVREKTELTDKFQALALVK